LTTPTGSGQQQRENYEHTRATSDSRAIRPSTAAAKAISTALACSASLRASPDGSSSYLRLSTRLVNQSLAAVPTDPAARERRRRQVLAGAYTLRGAQSPAVTIVGMGAMITQALEAADRLAELAIQAEVVCVTSASRLFEAVQARRGLAEAPSWILGQVFPAERPAPMVTILDGHPHTLAFLSTINQVPTASLGVTRFGQAGSLDDVYRYHGIDTDSIVRATLDLTA